MEDIFLDNKNITRQIESLFKDKCAVANLCPVKDILARVSDKWSIHTILLLGKQNTLRFTEVKTGIKDISQRMLAVTLRSLEEDGIVQRTSYATIPPRVNYQLTTLGKTLLPQLINLCLWANNNCTDILSARKKYVHK